MHASRNRATSETAEPRVEQATWRERVGDQIVFHSAEITVPADTTDLTYGDILRLNGIDTGPEVAALRAQMQHYWSSRQPRPPLNMRWYDDLLSWCRERGIPSEQAIADWLGVRRETLWHWRQGRTPRPKSTALIVEKTEGDVDPRRAPRRRYGGGK